jgi:hypothetical protein
VHPAHRIAVQFNVHQMLPSVAVDNDAFTNNATDGFRCIDQAACQNKQSSLA